MSKFNSIDIGKIGSFIRNSEDIKKEFSEIKKEFNRINKELLGVWMGEGADAYSKETNHILENIGNLDDVLESLTTDVLVDIKKNFDDVDKQLGEFNLNPFEDEKEKK